MKDEKKALELYLKSAKGGLSYALRSVGDCYYYGRIMKDRSKAFKWYLKAAKKENWFYWNRKVAINGNIHAQFELAEYYLNSNSINKNEKKAFRWYMKLANDNEPRALYIVAKCYRDGVGTDKDLKEAIKWSVRYEESKVF
ncbi:HCP-like protein [Rhizophagus irregularis]|uniref:HCP-like protein n=1 Tax=Rhizophagus irregularis TaxID=588596 RepID=A0A2N0RRG1_9GLOM|nr:HCP-like protein [Rhizophagus irregularis]